MLHETGIPIAELSRQKNFWCGFILGGLFVCSFGGFWGLCLFVCFCE